MLDEAMQRNIEEKEMQEAKCKEMLCDAEKGNEVRLEGRKQTNTEREKRRGNQTQRSPNKLDEMETLQKEMQCKK